MSDSLRPHELQHTRPPCPSPTPGVHPNSSASSRWCHPAISSLVVPFSSCPQSLPASESFPMSQLFTWGSQSIVSVFTKYCILWIGLIALEAFIWIFIISTNKWRSYSIQSLSHVWLIATTWTAACQASLSITNSQSLFKLMSIEYVMPSNHLILWHPLLLLPSVFPSIKDFVNELAVPIRWSKYWIISFSISPSSEYSGLMSGLVSLQSKGLSGAFYSTTVWRHQFFGTLPSLPSSSHNCTWPLGRPQPWIYEPLSAQ